MPEGPPPPPTRQTRTHHNRPKHSPSRTDHDNTSADALASLNPAALALAARAVTDIVTGRG